MIHIFLNSICFQFRLILLWYVWNPFFMNKSVSLCLFGFSSIRGWSMEYNIMPWWMNAINSSMYCILWVYELEWSLWQVEVIAESAFGSRDGCSVSQIFGQQVVLAARDCQSLNSKKESSNFSRFIECYRSYWTSQVLLALSNSTALCYKKVVSQFQPQINQKLCFVFL